ncbi:MAG: TonB-dependent receptor [Alphaproteobacteria bacterium]|nr:TonB-dependent receptor [Alphaproteobacteria bacterium]MBT4909986.1 TonB-dependent receptor [Alphaproteobacteria bacterium]MBT5662824.1 TonB-dependent receptor [Alphaproteobacteria bacterium]
MIIFDRLIMGLVTLSFLTFTSFSTISAQDNEEASSLGIEEIIVTARKREESLQDVPIAITAVTEQLQDATIRNIADLSAFAPNVIIGETSVRARGSAITLRGINSSESDKSLDPKILVELDGVAIGTNSGQIIENFDLERIEILRGPQGTLFGKNTNGGVIRVMRSRPTGEFGGKVEMTIGDNGQEEFRALINTPIVEDILALKVFGTTIKNDGHIYNTFLKVDGPKKDYTNYGATFLFTPNDKFEALLTIEQYDDGSDVGAWTNENDDSTLICNLYDPSRGVPALIAKYNPGGYSTCKSTAGLGPTENATNDHNPGQFDTDAYTLNMTYDLSDSMTLTYVGAYREEGEQTTWEYDGTPMPWIWIDAFNAYEQESHEVRLEIITDKANITTGAYFWDSTYRQDWVTRGSFWSTLVAPELYPICEQFGLGAIRCEPGLGATLGENYAQKLLQTQNTESKAIFVNIDYQLNEKLMLTGGLRYTEEEKEFTGGQSYLTTLERAYINNFESIGLPGEVGVATLTKKYDEISGVVGLSYKYTEEIMFYATYKEGFQSGGFFGRNQNVADFKNTYDPEYAKTLELGMKSLLMDKRVQLNIAAFRNDFEDKQEDTIKLDPSTKTVVTVIDNVAGVLYQGLEIESRFLVSESFEAFVNVGLLDAEYDGFIADLDGANAEGLVEPTNNDYLTPKYAPEMTASFGGTFTTELGDGELQLFAKYSFVDELYSITDNRDVGKIPSTEKIDASITFLKDSYKISLFGRNLTDEITSPVRDISSLMIFGSPSVGTVYGITLSANF